MSWIFQQTGFIKYVSLRSTKKSVFLAISVKRGTASFLGLPQEWTRRLSFRCQLGEAERSDLVPKKMKRSDGLFGQSC